MFPVLRQGLAALAWLTVATATLAQTADIPGAGATFPAKIYERWGTAFKQAKGLSLAYRPTGSGDGVRQMQARQVMFGGTDVALTPQELTRSGLIQIPTVAGAVTPVVQLRALGNQTLRLDGPVLAEIFTAGVTRWNDPRIAALNPTLKLPDTAIQVIVREDSSGTTKTFTSYLAKMSPGFAQQVGAHSLPTWPAPVIKAQGNGGVVKRLQQTEGAIAYVGFDRVASDALSAVALPTPAGQWLQASEDAIRAAVRASDVHRRGDDTAPLINIDATGAWPITVVTYVLLDAQPATAKDVEPAIRFLFWSLQQGDQMVKGTGFASLPVMLQARLATRLMGIKPRDGSRVSVY